MNRTIHHHSTSLAALLLLLLFASHACGQNIIRPKIECPNNIYVNAYNGVLFHPRHDLTVPTRGVSMTLVFYYNSIYNTVNYGYGNGWSLGIQKCYIPDSTGVTIVSGDGRRDRFVRYGSSYLAPAGVFATLSADGTTLQLTQPDGTRYLFSDTLSRSVTQIIDHNNNSLLFAYSGTRLTSLSDASGRSILFQWTDDRLTQVSTSFNSWRWTYHYDALGNLTQVTDPAEHSTHYGYNRHNRMVTLSDNEGNTTSITYADDNTVSRITTALTDRAIRYDLRNSVTTMVDYMADGVNQFTSFRWDRQGRITSIEGDNATKIALYEYDNANNIVRQTDGNGNPTSFTYDNHGNLLSYRDPMNQVTRYSYNNFGQLVSVTDPLNHTTTYAYDNYGNLASMTDPLNHTTLYDYSPAGQLMTLTTPNQGASSFNFDHQNRLVRFVNPLNVTIRYQYDSRGNLDKVFYPLNHTYGYQFNGVNQLTRMTTPRGDSTTVEYNSRLFPSRITDVMGHATRLCYDSRNRLTCVVDALGDSTFIGYDGVDNITRIQYPNGRVMDYRYNNLNQLVLVADQIDTLAAYSYDALGRIVAATNEAGKTATYAYDALGHLISLTDGAGHSESYAYDAAGNLTSHTDALNHTTTYAYDAANRLVEQTDPLGHTSSYAYDANGNLVSMTDANGHTTQYSYNANNQVTDIRFANNAIRHYGYNVWGQIASYTNEAGETLLYAYDVNGNLTRKSCSGQMEVIYTRDALGRITSASRGTNTVSYAYDALGRITSESNGSASTTYLYDRRNRTRTLGYPGGRTIEEQYDLRGNLTEQAENGTPFAHYSYRAAGVPQSFQFGNNTATSFAYNDADLIAGITTTPQIMNLQNTYDAAGNLLGRTDGVNAGRSECYAYDHANRLIDFKRGTATAGVDIPNPLSHIQYVLDALGNRNSVNEDGTTTPYSKNDINQYTQMGSTAIQYDSKGNLSHDGLHGYGYDLENNLVAVDGGTTATYAYDAMGRRISKSTSEGTTYYYYDGNNLIEERDAQGNTTATYVYANGIDQIVQMRRGAATYYYHTDGQGSVMAVTNASGEVEERYAYDPYGSPLIYDATGSVRSQSAIHNRILYTGREYDAESGLYHYRARAMQPEMGRFNQTDPLLYFDDKNLYSYVGNMPTSYIDPLGTNRNIDWADVGFHTVDVVSGGMGMSGKLGDLASRTNNEVGGLIGLGGLGYGMSNGIDLMDKIGMGMTAVDMSFVVAEGITGFEAIAVTAAGSVSAAAAFTTLGGAAAAWGAFKFGWAVGSLINDFIGDEILDVAWRILGDKDEDIKATGVYPRFPEPCGGSSNSQKKK